MTAKFKSLENERKSMPRHRLTTQDMHSILDQERLFFELTKAIMDDKDPSSINFNLMNETTKKAYDFMRKLLTKSDIEDRVLQLY